MTKKTVLEVFFSFFFNYLVAYVKEQIKNKIYFFEKQNHEVNGITKKIHGTIHIKLQNESSK